MSNNREYEPSVPLRIVTPPKWRSIPQMYLGRDSQVWGQIVTERLLGELAAPDRNWKNAELAVQGGCIKWVDDCDAPLQPAELFWREACSKIELRHEQGSTNIDIELDFDIPLPMNVRNIVQLCRRCTSRGTSRSLKIAIDTVELCIQSNWANYLSQSHTVESLRNGVDRDFNFVVMVPDPDSHLKPSLEIIQQGISRGLWPEIIKLHLEFARGQSRILLHTEMTFTPEEREERAGETLRKALNCAW